MNDEIVPEDVQIFEDEISTVSENTLISEAGFSARISNRIVNDLGCNTLGDLCKCTSNDLMRLKGLGVVAVQDINEKLKEYGLSLREEAK